ncbi:MATE efflux family protein [Scleroderma citrinum]
MSHQHSTSQSLPHDYAILSHFNDDARYYQDYLPSVADDEDEPPHPRGVPIRRVASMTDVSERTPLIKHDPPIPRIYETTDDSIYGEPSNERIPSAQMFQEELGILTRYSLPVFATHVFEYSFILASVICIGHISTTSLAAGTLGMMTASVTGYAVVQGFASTLDTLLPPAWTSDTPHMVGLWIQRMVAMTAFGLIPILALWFNAEPVLLLLGQEPEVAHLAAVFLKYAAWGLPAYSFNCISRRYFQCQGLFTVPARITMLIAPFNAFLNWFFVYPLGLSFRGAPIATALSFNLVSLASILYGYYFVPRTAWTPIGREIWNDWGLLARLGIAGIGQIVSEWWTWEITGFAAGMLGPVTLAAQSTLLITASLTFQAPFALSVATSVRIGNLLGEGKSRRAAVVAQISHVIAAAIGCIWCTAILIFRTKWAYLFNGDPDVISVVSAVLPITALSLVFDGINAIAAGVLRARGMQGVGVLLNLRWAVFV